MATDLRQLRNTITTVADFRAWAQGIHDQLIACGLVQTTDTGQVDLATVALPGSNAYSGYRIYRFNDALQATKPVFIKLQWGQASVASRGTLQFQVATATNGAGVMQGQIGQMNTIVPTGNAPIDSTSPSYCSGDGSRICLFNNGQNTSGQASIPLFFLVERPRDASGVPLPDGIVWFYWAGSTVQRQYIPYSGSIPNPISSNPAPVLAPGSTTGWVSAVGGNISLSPWLCFPGKLAYLTPLCYMHADIGELTPITVPHLGASRTYLPLGDVVYSTAASMDGAGASIAMLWE